MAIAGELSNPDKKPLMKSSVSFDVIPFDGETDLTALEAKIREIEMDGLVWTSAEQKPFAFGLYNLTITCTIVDDLVPVHQLQAKIEAFEDEVQSVDLGDFVYNAN